MISSLYLENWKTHFNSTIDFTKGTNIIIGKIGSGKSSIVDAICYALYGSYPSLYTKKITISETITFKPIKKDSSKVVLFFEYENNNYKIERELFTTKTNTAKLYKNEKLIAGPKQTDVNERVSEILGIDYTLFIKIVYSEQNEIDYFLKIPPGKRKEQFDSLFGISNLENIKINSRELSRLLLQNKEKQQALYEQINDQIKIFDISKKTEDLNTLVIEKNKIIENIDKENLRKKGIKEIYEKEQEKKNNHDKKNLEKNILLSNLKNLETKLDSSFIKTKNIEELVTTKKELEIQKEAIEKKNKEIELKTKDLENQLSFYNSQILQLKTEIEKTKSKIIVVDLSKHILEKETTEKKHLELKQKTLELTTQLKEIIKAIEELNKDISKCPVCDSLLTKEQIAIKLKEKQAQKITKTEIISENEKEINQLLILLKKLEEEETKIKENKTLEEKLNEKSEKQKEFLEKTEYLKAEQKNIDKKIETTEVTEKLKIIEYTITQQKLLDEKENLQINLKKTEEFLNILNYSEENYLLIFTDYKNIETKINYLSFQKENLEKQERELKNTITNYKALEEKQETLKKELEKTESNLNNLGYFTNAIDSSQNQLRTGLVNNINKALNIIWPRIYPYSDYISARLKTENDYVLEVQTKESDWIRVEGLLSGGERTCAALSIRIAIALSLTKKLGLLILDEPTHNLDSKTIETISLILDKELPELVDQIFIITHDSKLLSTTNTSKYTIERDKENNGFSKIIML